MLAPCVDLRELVTPTSHTTSGSLYLMPLAIVFAFISLSMTIFISSMEETDGVILVDMQVVACLVKFNIHFSSIISVYD
jgi:hypothetical protein